MVEENERRLTSKCSIVLSPFWRQAFVTAAVAVNIVGHGCVIGIAAVINPSLRKVDSDIHATPSEESWIASIIGFALITGNIIITPLMDTIGRKKSHLMTIVPNMVGWIILLFVKDVGGIIAARYLQGIAMGMLGPLGSIIIGEKTDPKNRGMLLTMVSLSLTTGVLMAHTLGTFLTWRMTALTCSFVTFTSLILILYCPESPSWLISKGRFEEGRRVFFYLRGNEDEHEKEFEKMVQTKQSQRESIDESQPQTALMKLNRFFRYVKKAFRQPVFYKPVIVMFCTYTMFQFSGINVISSYAPDIINAVVGPTSHTGMLMVLLDVERLVCNVLAVVLMKVSRRRVLLFSNGLLCVVAYLGKALYLYLKTQNRLPFDHVAIPITLIALYMFSLTVGISSVTFAISGEIFPVQYRGLGSGISILGLSINFFVAVKCFPMLEAAIGLPLTYCLYAGIVSVLLTVIWIMLPETKDRTLHDIEEDFRGRPKQDMQSAQPLNEKPREEMRRCSSHILY